MGKFGKMENSLRVVHNRFSVGAAVGSGMAARAAEKAGADFILALGAGKMRSMGVPSPASLLPIYDAVELTLEFAALELVPRVQLPVYVGLPLFDPRLKIDDLLHRLRTLGISGITNFPAVFHFGKRACLLEAHGLGLDREIEFLNAAKSAGFATIGYVRSRDEATKMVGSGLTSLCINFGLNPLNRNAPVENESHDRLSLAAKDIVDSVRKPNKRLTIYLGGGSIFGGADLDKLCRKAGIDGFIGGSAMDQAPLEKSLVNSVASFREIEVLQVRVERLERRLRRYNKRYGIVCRSDAMDQMLDSVETIVATGNHLVLQGEPSTGRGKVADMAANKVLRRKNGKRWRLDFSSAKESERLLFGSPKVPGHRRDIGILELATDTDFIVIKGLKAASSEIQNKVAQIFMTGEYCLTGEDKTRQCTTRFILIADKHSDTGPPQDPDLIKVFRKTAIQVPPLRDRIEDIALLVKVFMSEFTNTINDLAPPILRALIRHNWPGNLAELRETVSWLVKNDYMTINEAELIAFLGQNIPAVSYTKISQRDRIVQALLLNNLNRTKTAEQLGITRKTLYNQIKKYKILT